MTDREKLALLEDMMELDEGDLTLDTALDDIDGIKLTGDTIKGFETVGDIVAMMNK